MFNDKVYQQLNIMKQPIIGFHKAEAGDWVADLKCGHIQHEQHNTHWQLHPWVVTEEGRKSKLGIELNCKKCERIKSF